jgi:threonine dehydratase
MCRHFGVQGTIFMPVTTPQQKIQKTQIFGGDTVEIKLVGDYFDDCLLAGAKILPPKRRALPVAL